MPCLETLRLGDGEVPICRLSVRPGSPLIGLDAADVKRRFGCAVLARSGSRGRVEAGDGGSGGGSEPPGNRSCWAGRARTSCGRRPGTRAGRRGEARGSAVKPRPHATRLPTRLPQIAAALTAILVAAVFVFGRGLAPAARGRLLLRRHDGHHDGLRRHQPQRRAGLDQAVRLPGHADRRCAPRAFCSPPWRPSPRRSGWTRP